MGRDSTFCDHCGCDITDKMQGFVSRLLVPVASACEGESGVFCEDCYELVKPFERPREVVVRRDDSFSVAIPDVTCILDAFNRAEQLDDEDWARSMGSFTCDELEENDG